MSFSVFAKSAESDIYEFLDKSIFLHLSTIFNTFSPFSTSSKNGKLTIYHIQHDPFRKLWFLMYQKTQEVFPARFWDASWWVKPGCCTQIQENITQITNSKCQSWFLGSLLRTECSGLCSHS